MALLRLPDVQDTSGSLLIGKRAVVMQGAEPSSLFG